MRLALSKLMRHAASRLLAASRRLSQSTTREIDYAYASLSIKLPPGHRLPEYRRDHGLYDRFLPVLVTNLEPGALVVDVGANCGDTLAGMFESNRALQYLCIEPDPKFFDYLESNVARIRAASRQSSITTCRALIGRELKSADLEGVGGTRHAVAGTGPGSMRSVTLDDLLQTLGGKSPRLIKSDVDGFDYDVIQSARATVRDCRPLLFLECQVDTPDQKDGFERMVTDLAESGYADWTVFDNFGNLMIRTDDAQTVRQLFDYVWRQTLKMSKRTVYYFDILVSTRDDAALVDAAIEAFLRQPPQAVPAPD